MLVKAHVEGYGESWVAGSHVAFEMATWCLQRLISRREGMHVKLSEGETEENQPLITP